MPGKDAASGQTSGQAAFLGRAFATAQESRPHQKGLRFSFQLSLLIPKHYTNPMNAVRLAGLLIILSVMSCLGDTYFVWTNSPSDGPGTNWATAFHDIQGGVDAAGAGDTVLVTNGIYDTGGVLGPYGIVTSRVAVADNVIVESVNGPGETLIVGQGPLNNAIRCVYMGANTTLSGFCLTNGYATFSGDEFFDQSGGGAWCEVTATISNCLVAGNIGWMHGGGIYRGTVIDSTVRANRLYNGDGAGVYGATVTDCMIITNWSQGGDGGGVCESTVFNSTLVHNKAGNGGGSKEGSLTDCIVASNSASWGGGVFGADSVSNCAIIFNRSTGGGGGAHGSTIRNSLVALNRGGNGGATSYTSLENCTIVGNTASMSAGGLYYSAIDNCILYYNSAPMEPNYQLSTVSNSCTSQDPGGSGNVTNPPGLLGLDNLHIVSNSVCVDSGVNRAWMGASVDTDGEARIYNVDVDRGADEFVPAGMTGTITVAVIASHTNAVVGFPIDFECAVGGRASGYRWVWDDGQTNSAQCRVDHSYAAPGSYDVVLYAWNNDGSASATVSVQVVGGYTNYVSTVGGHNYPFISWADAATNIQAAVSANNMGGGVVLVTNGVYDKGGAVVYGALTNRVAITNGVLVRSVNGPALTTIQGDGPVGDSAVRCAYVGNNGVLEGFALVDGYTRGSGADTTTERSGGGVWCERSGVVSSCIITRSFADMFGGGGYSGTLMNSIVSSNSAASNGGGLYASSGHNLVITGNSSSNSGGGGSYLSLLNSSTVFGNSASNNAGGLLYGVVSNCIIFGNVASVSNDMYSVTAVYSCSPNLAHGINGNITNAPQFVSAADPDGADNIFMTADDGLSLQQGGPCIDAGTSTGAPSTDITGQSRPLDGDADGTNAWDMGAYEVLNVLADSDGDGMPDWWEDDHFGHPTNELPDVDPDSDEAGNLDEYRADTQPTNVASVLRITGIVGATNLPTVYWTGGIWATQYVDRCTNLVGVVGWESVTTNAPPTAAVTNYTDLSATNTIYFYRIRTTR